MAEALNNPQVNIDTQSITPQMVYQAVGGLEKLVFERIEAMDRAVALLQDIANRSPTINEVSIKCDERFDKMDVKFDGIQRQFAERDVRFDGEKQARNDAVNTAVQTVKAQNEKMEQVFTKQIDGLADLLRTEVKGIDARINELTNRLNRGEGKEVGVDKNKTDLRMFIGVLVGVLGLIIGVVGVLVRWN